jgi:hypothetical protein
MFLSVKMIIYMLVKQQGYLEDLTNICEVVGVQIQLNINHVN